MNASKNELPTECDKCPAAGTNRCMEGICPLDEQDNRIKRLIKNADVTVQTMGMPSIYDMKA